MPIGIRVTDLPAAAGTLDDDDEFLSLEDGSLRRATRTQAGPKAAIVQVADTANQFTGTNVETVLAEIQDNVDALVISGGGISVASEAEALAGTDNTKAMTPLRVNEVLPSFDVRRYGAVGDGLADDTAAIQAALNAAAPIRGEVIIPRHANPFIFTRLDVPAGVTFRSLGGWLKLADGTCTNALTTYYLVNNIGGTGDIRLIDLLIDGNAANNGTFLAADGITVTGENVVVSGCHVLNPPDSAIMWSRVTNGSCVNNRLDGSGSPTSDIGIYVNDGTGDDLRECVVAHNRITGFRWGGIALKRTSRRTIVASNVIYDCGNGITLEQGAGSDFSTDVQIVDNRCRRIGYINTSAAGIGVGLRGSDHVACTENRIEDPRGIGILVEGCRWSTIADNVVSCDAAALTTLDGIRITDRAELTRGSSGLTVHGNVVTDARRDGIRLTAGSGHASTDNTYVGNVVTGAGNAALRIEATHDNMTVVGNVLGGLLDVELFAGATNVLAAQNRLVTGAVSGVFEQVTMNAESGRLGVGNIDTYLERAAADIVDGPAYRSRGNLQAHLAGVYPVSIGNVGGVVGISFGPSGGAPDSTLVRAGVNHLRAQGIFEIDGALDHDGTTVGLYGVAPVARAAAIASPTADVTALKTAVDALRVALTNIGITS